MKNVLCVIFIVIIIAIVLPGCGRSEQAMDKPADDGKYHYQNKDLGFALTLPGEFEYYQTQRKDKNEYIDLEFFVPTSDKEYPQTVLGYGKPIVIRIFSQDSWKEINVGGSDKIIYRKLGEKAKRVYTIRFWDKIPNDWQDKWSEEIKNEIIKNFKIK